eukprot:7349235-Prymnesium_polylepis.1
MEVQMSVWTIDDGRGCDQQRAESGERHGAHGPAAAHFRGVGGLSPGRQRDNARDAWRETHLDQTEFE